MKTECNADLFRIMSKHIYTERHNLKKKNEIIILEHTENKYFYQVHWSEYPWKKLL